MKKLWFLLVLGSCSVATDPKIYEDVVGLVEEIVKDEGT